MIATISYSKGKLFKINSIITVITYLDSSMLEIHGWFESSNEKEILKFLEEKKIDNVVIDMLSLDYFSKKNKNKLMDYNIILEN